MNDFPDLSQIVPPKYQWLVTLLVVLVPLAGRGWHALRNDGGLVGIWNAILFGTNTPKTPIEKEKEIEKEKVPPTTVGLFLVLALVLGLTACVSTPRTLPDGTVETPAQAEARRVESVVKMVAMNGTILALKQNPDWREDFVAAADLLLLVQQKDKLTLDDIYGILVQLPIKELKSDTAQITILNAKLLLDEFDSGSVDLNRAERLKPIAKALYEGIELGLKAMN